MLGEVSRRRLGGLLGIWGKVLADVCEVVGRVLEKFLEVERI